MEQITQENMGVAEEDVIDLVEVFYYLKHRLIWLILALMIGGTAAGAVSYYFITPKYEATSKVYMVSASKDALVDLTDLNLGTSLSEDYEEMLKIRSIYESVVEQMGLDYTYEDFLEMIDITTVGKTRILQITVESKIPEEAKEIANMLAESAVDYLPDLMETSEPHIAEYAILPEEPSSPNLIRNTIIGAILATVGLIGIFMFQFMMDDTFQSAEDVERIFGEMPLTVIPECDGKELKGKKRNKKKRKS